MTISTALNKRPQRAGRISRPGAYGKRIIRTIRKGDREYQLHATKGWRSYRVTT